MGIPHEAYICNLTLLQTGIEQPLIPREGGMFMWCERDQPRFIHVLCEESWRPKDPWLWHSQQFRETWEYTNEHWKAQASERQARMVGLNDVAPHSPDFLRLFEIACQQTEIKIAGIREGDSFLLTFLNLWKMPNDVCNGLAMLNGCPKCGLRFGK